MPHSSSPSAADDDMPTVLSLQQHLPDDTHSIAYPPYAPLHASNATGVNEAAPAIAHTRTNALARALQPTYVQQHQQQQKEQKEQQQQQFSAPSPALSSSSSSASTMSSLTPLTYSSHSSLAQLARTGSSGSESSSGSAVANGPLRVPLLEEEIRLLKQALDSALQTRDSYKSQIFALEKQSLDQRESLRVAQEDLQKRTDQLEDWKYRDDQFAEAERAREREWMRRIQEMESEVARVKKHAHELEDALYTERTTLAEVRSSAAQALQSEQRFRADVEEQLKKQVRSVCIERNTAVQRCSELSADLATATALSTRLATEKAALFDQLYSASRLGSDHQPVRECRAPEAALLELQRTEMESLRSRLDTEADEANTRIAAMRVELRSSRAECHELREKVGELKGALKKCMAAMDSQRAEVEQERKNMAQQRAAQPAVPPPQQPVQPLPATANLPQSMQPEYPRPFSAPSNETQQTQPTTSYAPEAHQPVLSPLYQEQQLSQRPVIADLAPPQSARSQHLQHRFVEQPPPAIATQAVPAAAQVLPPQSLQPQPHIPVATSAPAAQIAATPFHLMSSREALAHTQLLLQQEQAAAELRRQRREERRQALATAVEESKHDDTPRLNVVTAVPSSLPPAPTAASAPVAAMPSVQPSAPASARASFPLDLSRVDGWSGTAPSGADVSAPVSSRAPAPAPAASSADTSAALTARAPIVISAEPPQPLPVAQPAAAEPAAAIAPAAAAPPLPAVTFDFSYMDSLPSMRPYERVHLQPHTVSRFVHSGVGAAPPASDTSSSEAQSFEEAKEEQMQRALEHAMREVEQDQRQRHMQRTAAPGQQSRAPPTAAPLESNEMTLEYALSQLSELKRQAAESSSRESTARSSARSGVSRRSTGGTSSAQQQQPRRTSMAGSRPSSAAAHGARSSSVKKHGAAATRTSTTPRESGSNHEPPALGRVSSALYKPSAAVLAAAGMTSAAETDDDERSPRAPAAIRPMPPLRSTAAITLSAPLSPAQQRAADRAITRTVANLARSSVPLPRAQGGPALAKVTSSLRNVAASLKKHNARARV